MSDIIKPNSKNISNTSEVIAEVEVEVIRMDKKYAYLKLKDKILKYERSSFPGLNNVRFGQHFLYQIHKDSKGFRFQVFKPIEIKTKASDKEKIEKYLSQF